MSEIGKSIKSFAEEVIARLKGDEGAAIAAKNERKARSAFNQQISATESAIVDAEVAVEEAGEALADALYPTELIGTTEDYMSSVANAKDKLSAAENKLETLKEQLKFFKDTVATF
jgi:hypothetical protein